MDEMKQMLLTIEQNIKKHGQHIFAVFDDEPPPVAGLLLPCPRTSAEWSNNIIEVVSTAKRMDFVLLHIASPHFTNSAQYLYRNNIPDALLRLDGGINLTATD